MARLEANIARAINNIADFCAFTGAFVLGCLTRYELGGADYFYDQFNLRSLLLLYFLFYFFNEFSLSLMGAYPIRRLRKFAEKSWIYLKSVLAALLAVIVIVYALYPLASSRVLIFSAAFYAFVFLNIKEYLITFFLQSMRKKGGNIRHVVMVGHDEHMIRTISEEIEKDHFLGMRVTGIVTPLEDSRERIASWNILGSLDNIGEIVEKNVVDCVIFLGHGRDDARFQEAIWKCQQRGIEIWIKLGFLSAAAGSVALEHITRTPFLNLRSGPQNATALLVKYAMDRVGSLLLLLALSPLFLICALLVKLTSPGPVFFRQHRASINGRRFVFYKFRSMVTNAEEMKDSLRHKNEMSGPVFKIKDDPRITPVGKFLRKYSLDELPQLWNVLRGEMSLVGPRPLPVREAEQTSGWQRRRLTMKPGLTCLWQVSGRNAITDFDDWAKLDLKYIDEWTLWLDIKILFMTIPAVLQGR